MSEMAITQLAQLNHALQQTTLSNTPDTATWKWTTVGEFTVKSMYQRIKETPTILTRIHRLWKLSCPPRMIVFGWLMVQNKLLTIDNLNKRGWYLTNRCIMCTNQLETVKHLFSTCSTAKQTYLAVASDLQITVPREPIQALTEGTGTKRTRSILLITQFILWRERCNRTFRDSSKNTQQLTQEVIEQWSFYSCARGTTSGNSTTQ